MTWNGSQHLFHVVDKGKIPPNTPVAWVVPAGGLSLLASPTVTTIACSVEQISALGQIAVIQLCTVDGKHNIIWGPQWQRLSAWDLHQASVHF
ncbi:hypothetical protein [Polynucleobacter necessarius]|uniref:hypothetical protein n=1 Tax=Polynucleobacter necessarius TaxID=576610 RepID=UPI0013B062B5|nr:hypothetical protein [Polynucleobacter necessarius]